MYWLMRSAWSPKSVTLNHSVSSSISPVWRERQRRLTATLKSESAVPLAV